MYSYARYAVSIQARFSSADSAAEGSKLNARGRFSLYHQQSCIMIMNLRPLRAVLSHGPLAQQGAHSPSGRRGIQFGSGGIGHGQPRLALHVSVCDGHRHSIIDASRARRCRCSRVTPDQGGISICGWPAFESRAWPPHPTPLHSGGTVRQGSRAMGVQARQKTAACRQQ